MLESVKVTTLPTSGTLEDDGSPVSLGGSVSASDIATGKLVFTPDSNETGAPYATFTFQVKDDGGTANGGVDLDQSPNTMTIDVASPVNRPTEWTRTRP